MRIRILNFFCIMIDQDKYSLFKNSHTFYIFCRSIANDISVRFDFSGEVSGENVSAGPARGGEHRGEAADLGTHSENNDGATLAANTAVDARGGSPQGAHLSGAATPRPPRGRRRQNQNGLDTTQVSGTSVCQSRTRRAIFIVVLIIIRISLKYSHTSNDICSSWLFVSWRKDSR